MPLNDLDLNQLETLHRQIAELHDIGCDIVDRNLDPRFSLTLDSPMVASISFVIPPPRQPKTCAEMAKYRPTVMSGPWSEPEPRRDWSAEAEAVVIEAYLSETEPSIDPSHAAANALLRIGAVINPDRVSAYVRAHLVDEIREARITPSPEAAQPEPAPAPEETPLAAGDTAGGAPIPSATEQSAPGLPEPTPPAASEPQDDPQPVALVAEGSGGGEAMAAAASPAATHQDKLLPATWTAEEDEQLIATIVTLVRQGETKKAAIATGARDLGRPEAGTAFRAHHKLKARIDAALTAAAMEQAATEPLEDKPFTVQEGAAGEGATPPAAQPIEDEPDMEPGQRAAEIQVRAAASIEGQLAEQSADPLWTHITTLSRKDGWTLQRDIDLLDLAILGWLQNEISLELGVQAKLIRPRLDLLTGLYADDKTGKQIRRFKRETVLAALRDLHAQKAA